MRKFVVLMSCEREVNISCIIFALTVVQSPPVKAALPTHSPAFLHLLVHEGWSAEAGKFMVNDMPASCRKVVRMHESSLGSAIYDGGLVKIACTYL